MEKIWAHSLSLPESDATKKVYIEQVGQMQAMLRREAVQLAGKNSTIQSQTAQLQQQQAAVLAHRRASLQQQQQYAQQQPQQMRQQVTSYATATPQQQQQPQTKQQVQQQQLLLQQQQQQQQQRRYSQQPQQQQQQSAVRYAQPSLVYESPTIDVGLQNYYRVHLGAWMATPQALNETNKALFENALKYTVSNIRTLAENIKLTELNQGQAPPPFVDFDTYQQQYQKRLAHLSGPRAQIPLCSVFGQCNKQTRLVYVVI